MVVGELVPQRGNHGFVALFVPYAYHFRCEHHDIGDVLVNIFGHAS